MAANSRNWRLVGNAPPRVANIEAYWLDPPPEPSPRLKWWLARIAVGWRGNRRVLSQGYYSCAEYFGVYLWEWLNVLSSALEKADSIRN